jgi:hypothetical protein
MRLQCDVAIPEDLREARLFVRLIQDGADLLRLEPALGPSDATHQIVDAVGRPLLTPLSERDEAFAGKLMEDNVWDFLESLALLSVARPGMTFLDSGAAAGYASVLLAGALQPAGQIHAFEQDPNNTRVLTANALLTRTIDPLAARITVWGTTLSDPAGPGTTLDAMRFPQSGELPLLERHVDLLRATAPGCEAAVLRGGRRMLVEDRPILCLAFPPRSDAASGAELVRELQGLGYHAFRLLPTSQQNPYQTLQALAEVHTADDVVALGQRQALDLPAKLLAYPPVGVAGAADAVFRISR